MQILCQNKQGLYLSCTVLVAFAIYILLDGENNFLLVLGESKKLVNKPLNKYQCQILQLLQTSRLFITDLLAVTYPALAYLPMPPPGAHKVPDLPGPNRHLKPAKKPAHPDQPRKHRAQLIPPHHIPQLPLIINQIRHLLPHDLPYKPLLDISAMLRLQAC